MTRLLSSCLLLALFCAGIAFLPGQPVAKPAVKARPAGFECRFTDGKFTLDGKASEDAWKHAPVIDQFSLPWLGDKDRPPRTATRARLLWDREYLYFFADMDDADLYADVKQHDGMTWDNDVFELFFKPADDKPGYYEFQVNAAGTVMDLFLPRRGSGGYKRFVSDGQFHIESKVALRGSLNKWTDKDEGWSVEGRIPWKDFLRTGGRPEPGEKWKFALCRYDFSVDFEGPELSTCAPLKSQSTPNFHLHEDYATLQFLGPDSKQGAKPFGIDKRQPLTTSKVVGSPEPPPPYRARRVYPDLKLNFPICVVHQPGSDRLLFVTQVRSYGPSSIQRSKDVPGASEAETVLEFDSDTVAYDIAFHPQFKKNGYVYVGSNGADRKGAKKKTRVTRYTMATEPPYRLDSKSAQVIIEWESDGHNGGALGFGHDGMLYVTSGDGTSDSDTNVVGQEMGNLLGKVLRIDVDRPEPGKSYSVPRDNPFVAMKGAKPETWAYGLRNPWRLTVDAKTGHVWVGNNGQDLWEQAFLIEKGANYGWSVMEGSHPFYLERKAGPTPFVKPTVEHHHSEARSLTGGVVYHGKKFPDLQGAYIYGDYSTGKVWGVKHDGKKIVWHKELTDTTLQITGFGTDAQGELLICDHRGGDAGGFWTLEPTPKDLPPSTFPKKLSESGLFRSVKGHVVEPSLIPYSVNAELWSDGAHKERFLAIPGDGKIDYSRSRGWNCPDGTVLVKSFALETAPGDSKSRRWIETRFLTKQEGEWAGYSYIWNEEQTEATLVDTKGMDADIVLGKRTQKWHFPSRSECMVCHSRAANYVLGLTEVQMNRDHDYGGVVDNQLRVLERLGILRANWLEETKWRMREELKAQGKNDRDINAWMEKQTATRGQRTPPASTLLPFSPENHKRLVDPYDPRGDLTARARSYLHSNCSSCHVEAGGGNAQMELEFATELAKMRVVGVKPVHHTFNLPEARLIAPGQPERSVMLHRISTRQQGHMPPLSTYMVDERGVALMRDWIRSLKSETPR